MTIDPNRWYYFRIFERERDGSSAEFIGRRSELAIQYGVEALYEDQDGDFHYSYIDSIASLDGDFVEINSEALHSGRGIEDLIGNMRDWLKWMQQEVPAIQQHPGYECLLPALTWSVESGQRELRHARPVSQTLRCFSLRRHGQRACRNSCLQAFQ